MRKIKSFVYLTLFISIFLASCKDNKKDPNEIVLGTIAGPETILAEVAKKVAKNRYNIDIKIKEFNDYQEPNRALDEGILDANMFQHEPFLKKAMADHGYDFTILGKTFVYPMGLYSSKYKNLDKIPNGSVIAIPNDPSNGARALLLLEKAGLIKLDSNVDKASVTLKDIKSNNKHLKIRELDAAGIPRVLPDVALAAINTNYAILAGLIPSKDAIFLETKDSIYANVIVIKTKDVENNKFNQLKSSLQSQEVQAKAKELFKNQSIKAF
tara:strand:+ start:23639 stop:24445 length:807 start_codon:yes stop_codon:yes gene_type:complete